MDLDYIVSREEARANGLSHYFTGIPCSRGHLAAKLTSNSNCIMCNRENARRHRSIYGTDEVKMRRKWYYETHKV